MIRDYFRQFGDVSIKFLPKLTYAYVTFNNKTDAAKVLTSNVIVNNNKLRVYVRKPQSRFSAKQPLRNNNFDEGREFDTTIDDLNDNCLLEILSYLNIVQLSKMVSLNRRFQSIVHAVADRKCKTTVSLHFQNTNEIKSVLEAFGHLISELNIRSMLHNGVIPLTLLRTYCSGTLKSLNLRNFTIGKTFNAFHHRNLFKSLADLTFDDCTLHTDFIQQLLNAAKALKTLKLRKIHWSTDNVRVFYGVQSIEKLVIENCDRLPGIIKYLKELVINDCRFSSPGTTVGQIEQIKNLKKLHFDCLWEYQQNTCIVGIFRPAQFKNSLNHLSLSNFIANDDIIYGICALSNLLTLKLINVTSLTEWQLKQIGQHLTKLEEIHLIGCKPIEGISLSKLSECTKPKVIIN